MLMKKIVALFLAAFAVFVLLTACVRNPDSGKKEIRIGICNYVDDASLNQIVQNLRTLLDEIGEENNVTFRIYYENCNADANVLTQILSDFLSKRVDLMVGVATPVAVAMQAATEDSGTPVVFAAVSDPVGSGLVDSMTAPGRNITGTSDYLNTDALVNLILAVKPQATKVGLLYDVGQDSSTAAIASARKLLADRNITVVEHTGRTVDEIQLAAQAMVADGVDAVFTPTDNTVMKSELAIYETLAEAGIPHFAGADSFALNGAFLGYGVDYTVLGRKTADMAAEILLNGKKPASMPVETFDNGTATVNTQICQKLGLSFAEVSSVIAPYCTQVRSIITADDFDDVKK